jgi:hypothetical protein
VRNSTATCAPSPKMQSALRYRWFNADFCCSIPAAQDWQERVDTGITVTDWRPCASTGQQLPMTMPNCALQSGRPRLAVTRSDIHKEVASLNGYHSRTTWNFHAGLQVIRPGRFRFAKDPFTKARHQRVGGRFKRCHQKICKHGRPIDCEVKRLD